MSTVRRGLAVTTLICRCGSTVSDGLAKVSSAYCFICKEDFRPEQGIKEKLWEKLLSNPDDLTDLRIIFMEWVNTKARLDDYAPLAPPPLQHKFNTYKEREVYLEAVHNAQLSRKYIAALQETCDSLEGQLRMMAQDLPLETLDQLLQEIGG